jgi:hypothetical protein
MSISVKLQAKSTEILKRSETHKAYQLLFNPPAGFGKGQLVALLRNILLQTYFYGGHVTEAVFTAIGRFPKTKPQLMRPLVGQVLDEVYHPEMAGKDYVRLGGDPDRVDLAGTSPASFVMAAVCRTIAERADPFAYLGFLSLLESTTPVLTERLMPVLRRFGIETDSKFVPLHAKEDQAHAHLIWKQIDQVAESFPGAERAIEFGFDCLALVYPAFIWDEALSQTKAELGWIDVSERGAGITA